MKETIHRTSPVNARVSVEVPSERVNEHLNQYFVSVAKQARIQGFRPGKAPVHVVKQMYGQEAASSIGERIISEALLEVVRKHNLRLILPPTLIAVDAAKEGNPFRFEAELDLRPEIPEFNLEKIEIEDVPSKEVTDQEVMARLEEVRDHFSHHHLAPEGHIIATGDLAAVKYGANVNGERIEKACTARQELEFGKNSILPEFETGLLGLKVGDSKKISAQFPEDHQLDEIRGKLVEFEVSVLEIQSRHRPNWEEENLLERVMPGAKSLDDLKSKTREQLKSEFERNRKQGIRESLSTALLKETSFPVSQRQLDFATESVYNDRVQALGRMGLPPQEIESRKDEILKFAKDAAEREIRVSYVMDQIARDAKIEVNPEDIENRLKEIATAGGHSLTDVKNFYLQKEQDGSSSRLERLQMDLRDEKSLDYALSRVTIKNRGSNS